MASASSIETHIKFLVLHRQLDSQDDFIRLKASIILAAMISVDGSVSEEAMSRYLSSISALIGERLTPLNPARGGAETGAA